MPDTPSSLRRTRHVWYAAQASTTLRIESATSGRSRELGRRRKAGESLFFVWGVTAVSC